MRAFEEGNMPIDPMKLPLGISGFSGLRAANQIYVDKTDFIFQLARMRGRYFLSRPRRFGKSLLVSAFETLFRDGLKYFDGLKISELWKDKTYGVVTLDFSEIKDKESIETMSARFDEILKYAFESVGFAYKTDDGGSHLGQIGAWLKKQNPGSLVLLVDEYDAPLNSHLDNPEFFNQIRDMLSGFFSLVKSTDNAWRFIFITGIAKFNKASIFSAFNNLTDISLEPTFGTLLGYTEREILDNFKPFVENAAQVNGMDVQSLMDALRAQYDGFCFDEEAATHVYAPWSVLSFLFTPKKGLRDFWYDSAGNPSMIRNYLKKHSFDRDIDQFDEDLSVPLEDLRHTNDVETLAPEVFLFQSGYLSIKRINRENAYLNFPNEEVAHSMTRLMADQILRSEKFASREREKWSDALDSGDLDALIKSMNVTFLQINYEGYPLTRESHVRAAVQIYLVALGYKVTVEQGNSLGRSDLEFEAGDFHWVMEFKYARKGSKRDKLLADALEQIKEKHYGEGSGDFVTKGETAIEGKSDGKTLLRVGIVFDGVKRQFVRYAEAD